MAVNDEGNPSALRAPPLPGEAYPPPAAPEVGDKVRFTPAAYLGKTDGFCEYLDIEVTGEIVQVNEARRCYRVRYEVRPGCIRFETFKY